MHTPFRDGDSAAIHSACDDVVEICSQHSVIFPAPRPRRALWDKSRDSQQKTFGDDSLNAPSKAPDKFGILTFSEESQLNDTPSFRWHRSTFCKNRSLVQGRTGLQILLMHCFLWRTNQNIPDDKSANGFKIETCAREPRLLRSPLG